MARIGITRSTWQEAATTSNVLDIASHRILGLYVPVPPAEAFVEPVGLIATSRPRADDDGIALPAVYVGTADGPYVMPLDPQRPMIYEVPAWVDLLAEVSFEMVDAAGLALPAHEHWSAFWQIAQR